MMLFKYLSPDATEKVIGTPGIVSLRFNLPSSYSDPYELFLTPDEPLESVEERAYYEFFLRELIEAPVTCFSRRPESVVMWAHYSEQAKGICLAVREDKLVNQFDVAFVDDVKYSNGPACIPANVIRYAVATQKMRHTAAVLEKANRAAYFCKRGDWEYEQERWLVVLRESVTDIDGVLLAHVASECVDSVITGPNTPGPVRDACEKWTNHSGVNLLRMHCSKRLFAPYFTSGTQTFQWDGESFKTILRTCDCCGEPVGEDQEELCEWCQVTDADRANAATRNQLVACVELGVTPGVPFSFAGLLPRGRRFAHNPREARGQARS